MIDWKSTPEESSALEPSVKAAGCASCRCWNITVAIPVLLLTRYRTIYTTGGTSNNTQVVQCAIVLLQCHVRNPSYIYRFCRVCLICTLVKSDVAWKADLETLQSLVLCYCLWCSLKCFRAAQFLNNDIGICCQDYFQDYISGLRPRFTPSSCLLDKSPQRRQGLLCIMTSVRFLPP